MKIQKDMNRYKFQMGAELPPEMMQQMQGMPTEQGIPMEQGMPVEQGNGEASFAQQLMVIEQEIDKIQKEMKKLEKRNDKLAQNEYKRLEQQLMQLEQQKEMLRQQVEATRQQLEAQEQMQGEEYLDPNAQYEMSPEELDALEGQYQDVPMEEQINPEEMQMMQLGSWFNRTQDKKEKREKELDNTIDYLDETIYDNESNNDYNKIDIGVLKGIRNALGAFRTTQKKLETPIIEQPFYLYLRDKVKAKEENSQKKSFGGKMQTAGGLNSRKIYRKEDYVEPNVMWYDNMPQSVIDGYSFIHPDNRLGGDNFELTYVDNPVKRTSVIPSRTNLQMIGVPPTPLNNPVSFDISSIVEDYNAPTPQWKSKRQQRKENFKNGIQKINDYFGDVEPINIAQAVLPFIGALDNSHAIDNELSKNLTYSDNPYYRMLDYVNETYDSQQKALDRSYAQQINQARRDTNRAISSLQPRSVFGRDSLMTAKNIQLDEAKEKLDSSYLSGTSSFTANRNKDYSSTYDKAANINLENDQLNKALLKNFYKEEGVRRKEIYDMFQEGFNRIANIIQNKKDLAYLNTDWYKNLTDKEKAELEYQRWLRYYAGKNKKAQQTTGTEG